MPGPYSVSPDPAGTNKPYFAVTGVPGRADLPTVLKVTNSIAATGLVKVVFGRRSNIAGDGTTTPWITSWTDDVDTTHNGAAGAGWSGGDQEVCTFGTVTRWARRVYGSRALGIGTYQVWGRVQKTVTADDVRARLAWSAGSSAWLTNPTVILDPTVPGSDAGTSPTPVNLGTVTVERAGASVYAELYARRVSGSGSLLIDCLVFVPTEDYLEIDAGLGVVEEWDGDQYSNSVGSPVARPGYVQLTASGDIVRYHSGDPSGSPFGQTLSTVSWAYVTFDMEHTTERGTTTIRGYDSTAASSPSSRVKTAAGRELLPVVFLPSSGTDKYYFEVAATDIADNMVTVNGVRHGFVFYLPQNEYFKADPISHQVGHYNVSDVFLRDAALSGDWPSFSPGNNECVCLVFSGVGYPGLIGWSLADGASVSLTGATRLLD